MSVICANCGSDASRRGFLCISCNAALCGRCRAPGRGYRCRKCFAKWEIEEEKRRRLMYPWTPVKNNCE